MARARTRARVMPVRGLIGNPAFRRQKQNGIYTPIKSRLTPIAGWGFNGHANPPTQVNPTAPTVPLIQDAMSRAGLTKCYMRFEALACSDWISAGRPADFTGMTKWTQANNGLQAQLAACAATGNIIPFPICSSPGIGQNPTTYSQADLNAYFAIMARSIAPYTNIIETTNESINANDAYPGNLITTHAGVKAAIEAVNPNAIVLGPTGTWGFANNARQTAFWADNRAIGMYDGYASHIYDFNRNAEQLAVTAGIYPSVGSNQPTDKPRWMTEFGWNQSSAGIGGNQAGLALNYSRYLFLLIPNNSHDYFLLYQLQQLLTGDTFGLYDTSGAILAGGLTYLAALKHCNLAQTYRLYRPGAGTVYLTKMDCLNGPIGTSERLACSDVAGSTKTFLVYSHGLGTLNIETIGSGVTGTQTLQAGMNSVTVTLGTTAIVLWSPDCVVEFPEFLDS